jgi:formate dehydrogenase major subunit
VEVSPELAEERSIQSGKWVQLISRYGQVRVRALVTDRVQGRELYMPMNSVESPVNRLTSSHTDPVTNTPAYKETTVHLNVLPEIGESPLLRINSRFAHRRRRTGWKSNVNGGDRTMPLPKMVWCSCKPRDDARRTQWLNRFL